MTIKEYTPKSAMSIHAHPDDQEFTIAGTLARWADAGSRIISVLVTSGGAGSNDPSKGAEFSAELASLREMEQINANKVLGISETVFLHYPDGILEPTLDLRRDLTRCIRMYQPEAVVIGDPQTLYYGSGYINHPDHRAAALAGLYAAFPSAGSRFIFPELLVEGYSPHEVKRIYIHGSGNADTWVDITGTVEKKIKALKMHISQLGDWNPESMIRKWAADDGLGHHMAFGESYKVMALGEDS